MDNTTTSSGLLDLSEIDTRARWQQRPPNEFPSPWASEWGFDENGLWQTFVVPVENGDGISHKMRFIPKGEFLMGYPESEKERRKNETQHAVTLTQGFWLGETTVSQALWQAVMDKNPSHFKAVSADQTDDLPVDSISWDDSQQFFKQINQQLTQYATGLTLGFPTEAQWEYACRAGTQTPFNTGDNLTTQQANYDGNHPYGDNAKGGYRERTMPIRSFSPNGWGLYQMHGNVWEWCQDLYAPFNDAISIDSVNDSVAGNSEAENNALRVLRGGGWDDDARYCRSAARSYMPAADANRDVGLRVAQVEPSQQSEAALSEIDPPRSKGDEDSAEELGEVNGEINALKTFERQFRSHLKNKNNELIASIESGLTDEIGDFNDFDIEKNADSSTHYEVEHLECQFSSFEFIDDENQESKYQITTDDGNTVHVAVNIMIYFSAEATFSFSVRDSIDNDYVSLGDSVKQVEDSYETQLIITFLREHEVNLTDYDFEGLSPAVFKLKDIPTSINFGEIFPYMDSEENYEEDSEEEE